MVLLYLRSHCASIQLALCDALLEEFDGLVCRGSHRPLLAESITCRARLVRAHKLDRSVRTFRPRPAINEDWQPDLWEVVQPTQQSSNYRR